MFTYQDARGIQDSYSEMIIFYMCLVLIFFLCKKPQESEDDNRKKSLANKAPADK